MRRLLTASFSKSRELWVVSEEGMFVKRLHVNDCRDASFKITLTSRPCKTPATWEKKTTIFVGNNLCLFRCFNFFAPIFEWGVAFGTGVSQRVSSRWGNRPHRSMPRPSVCAMEGKF